MEGGEVQDMKRGGADRQGGERNVGRYTRDYGAADQEAEAEEKQEGAGDKAGGNAGDIKRQEEPEGEGGEREKQGELAGGQVRAWKRGRGWEGKSKRKAVRQGTRQQGDGVGIKGGGVVGWS